MDFQKHKYLYNIQNCSKEAIIRYSVEIMRILQRKTNINNTTNGSRPNIILVQVTVRPMTAENERRPVADYMQCDARLRCGIQPGIAHRVI